jgi:hypothetical protein
VGTLTTILGEHPYFQHFKPCLSKGIEFVFSEVISDSQQRKAELEANVRRGNHKQSAWGQEEKLKKPLSKDVKHGFALPIKQAW